MPARFSILVSMAVVSALACMAVGCQKGRSPEGGQDSGQASATDAAQGGYDPHDMPITDEQKTQLKEETATFSAAVAKIKEARDAVEQETRGGIPENPYKAHQALDQADLVLQWLPQIARDSAVPKDRWEELNTTANDLRTLFETVHQNIDNRQPPDFGSVAEAIDAKIAVLGEIAQRPPAGNGP